MIKLAGTVILYNPDEKIKNNILSYLDYVDKLYVIDNSENNNKSLLPKSKKIQYVFNNENIGLATALNLAANKALDDNYEWLLTMDQDSYFKKNSLDIMIKYLEKNDTKNLGLISPWHDYGIHQRPKINIEYLNFVMTSGNIINLNAYKYIGGFKDWLFIDCIDYDYCINLQINKYDIIRLNKAILKHTLGNIKVDKFLFKKITHSNHNYIRRYYITRNSFYIGNLYRKKFPKIYDKLIKEVRRDIIKIILLEKYKFRKLKNMLKGYIDYRKGITGKYKE